jgi:alpha-amylase
MERNLPRTAASPRVPIGLVAGLVTVLALPLGACAPDPSIDWCDQVEAAPRAQTIHADAGLIYEVYVRSFADSDGDGVGDLWGLADRLDHLERLGVRDIWLMPVFPSPSRAGYDVLGLAHVREIYGGDAALEHVIAEAGQRGMRVVLDTPINHTARRHPWFQEAERDPDAEMRGRYIFGHEQWDDLRWHPARGGDWYYGYFGADYPDLDWTHPAVSRHISGRLTDWLDRGVAGFRIDAVKQLVEEEGDISDTPSGHCLMAWLNGQLKAHDPEARVLAEAWTQNAEASALYLGPEARPEADMLLDVPRYRAFLKGFEAGQPWRLRNKLLPEEQDFDITHRMGAFSGSHDMPRLATLVPDAGARRVFLAGNFLLPGRPVLYYGEELDLPNPAEPVGQDMQNRGPMSWTDGMSAGFTTGEPWFPVDPAHAEGRNVRDQLGDPDSMLRFVLALSDLRQSSEAIQRGELTLIDDVPDSLLVFMRSVEEERVVVALSFSAETTEGFRVQVDRPVVELGGAEQGEEGAASEWIEVEAMAPYEIRVFGTEGLPGLPASAVR